MAIAVDMASRLQRPFHAAGNAMARPMLQPVHRIFKVGQRNRVLSALEFAGLEASHSVDDDRQ